MRKEFSPCFLYNKSFLLLFELHLTLEPNVFCRDERLRGHTNWQSCPWDINRKWHPEYALSYHTRRCILSCLCSSFQPDGQSENDSSDGMVKPPLLSCQTCLARSADMNEDLSTLLAKETLAGKDGTNKATMGDTLLKELAPDRR